MAVIDFGSTDYSALTSSLVDAQRQQRLSSILAREDKYEARAGGLSTMSTVLSSLSSSAARVDSPVDFRSYTVSNSEDGYVSVTATGSSVPDNLQIEVLKVGNPDRALSSFGSSSDTDVGGGSATISVGGDSFTITMGSGSGSLQELAAEINGSLDNTGVTATVINDGAGTSQLYLASHDIGTANNITLSATGGFASLGALDRTNFSDAPASDAEIRVNGVTITNTSSNTFDSVIPGLTIDALKLTNGTEGAPNSVTVSIEPDYSEIVSQLVTMVADFNDARSLLREGLAYDVTTRQAGALYGDATASGLDRKLSSVFTGTFGLDGANLNAPTRIGIEFDKEGNLTLDEARLTSLLQTNYDEVVAVISGAPSGQGQTTGIADALKSLAEDFGGATGTLAQQRDEYLERLKDIDTQKTRIETQLVSYEAILVRQFAALEALQSQIEGTSSFLDGQFNQSSS